MIGVGRERDLRIDLFRGIALLLIFIDHVPGNAVGDLTLRNFGFSDAAEIFVFLSGYSAALAYGPRLERNWLSGWVATLRRAWQIYIAHIALLLVSIALVLCVSVYFENRLYLDQMNVAGFVASPLETFLQSLLLRFRATNMDALPLYVLLLAAAGPLIAALKRHPGWVLSASVLLWAVAGRWNWNLETYPQGTWFFNPLCWQLLFVIGSACVLYPAGVGALQARHRRLVPLAIGYLVVSLAIVLSWRVPQSETWVPDWLARVIYPIDKSNLDVLRLLHFLALAYLISLMVEQRARWLRWPPVKAIVTCGQHSLGVFCLGIVLAFVAHVIFVEFGSSVGMHYLVSAAGCLVLIGVARALEWRAPRQVASRAIHAGATSTGSTSPRFQ
jgi:hypothetical protein